jgi:hypothetical protein
MEIIFKISLTIWGCWTMGWLVVVVGLLVVVMVETQQQGHKQDKHEQQLQGI